MAIIYTAKKIKNNILAMPALSRAIPVKPKTPAIKASTRKINDQFNKNIAAPFIE